MGSHNWKSSQEIWFEFFLFMLISQQIAAFWRLSFWRIKADRSKKKLQLYYRLFGSENISKYLL